MADHITSDQDDFDLRGLDALTPDSSTERNQTDSARRSEPPSGCAFRPPRLAKLACAISLVVFLPYLLQRLPDLSTRSQYRLKATDIQVIPPPNGPIPANLVEQVCARSRLPSQLCLLNADLCRTVSRAFSDHPWVARVVAVEKTFPAALRVRVEFRRPVAMVEVKGGMIPIDATATALPSEDFHAGDISRFPTIRGLGTSILQEDPDTLKDPGLVGAVRVADLLGTKWDSLKLEAIEFPRSNDKSQKFEEGRLFLRTKVGSLVVWGRPPGSDHPGELTAAQKVARLENYLEEFGDFDRPHGPYEIDIRHWHEITRRPAEPTRMSSRRPNRAIR